jgi:hypothetical protein
MNTKKALMMVLIAIVVVLVVGAGPRSAGTVSATPLAENTGSVGETIQYSGRLDSQGGQPASDGTYAFTFTLYATESGGEALWSEVQKNVPVENGVFQAALGSVQALPAIVLNGSPLWLAVAVRGPNEADFTILAPRQRLSPASSSLLASTSTGAACPHNHWGESWYGSGVGLYARSNNWVGLAGEATTSIIINPLPLGIFGVYGAGDDVGVLGESFNGPGVKGTSTNNAAVRGESVNHDGVSGLASASNRSGVYGYNSGSGYGVAGRSANGVGVEADGKDDGLFTTRKADLQLDGSYGDILSTGIMRLWSDNDVYVIVDANDDNFNGFTVFNGSGSAVFNVSESGSLWASGAKSAVVDTADQGQRQLYAMESPQVWFEDFGTATLVNGKVIVPIEPIFAETVNLEMDYHVFLTPLGDCNGLYVAAKNPTSFEVRELGGGIANIGFDYRIAALRRGYENTRLEQLQTRPTLNASDGIQK